MKESVFFENRKIFGGCRWSLCAWLPPKRANATEEGTATGPKANRLSFPDLGHRAIGRDVFGWKDGWPWPEEIVQLQYFEPKILMRLWKRTRNNFKRTRAFQNCFSLYCSEAQKHPQDKVFGFTIKLLFLRKLIKEDERNENREKVERRTRWDFTVCSPRAVSEALGLSEQEVSVGKDGCCDLGKPRDNSPVTVAACSCPALWPAWTGCTRI